MAVHPKLMIGAGIAVAGLGLIGAGAGATFTAQVSASTKISTGSVGLSLNGQTGSDVNLDIDGKNLDSHFAPITKDLVLKNTGNLDLASTFLAVTASGCDGVGKAEGVPLAEALHVHLTDKTNDKVVYDGPLCSLVRSVNGQGAAGKGDQGFITPQAHDNAGGQLPYSLKADKSILYRIVIQPKDAEQGLPTAAQSTSTSLKLVFTGFDY